jgi:hypothetical protein
MKVEEVEGGWGDEGDDAVAAAVFGSDEGSAPG